MMNQNPLLLSPFFPNRNLRAVVEIPAGTNKKFETDKQTGEIKIDIRDGRPRVVKYLPYPVNYGFVAGTRMDKARGGDGDPLDVLLICESLPSGTVLEAVPIALLKMTDLGELDHKVLAVPADESLRTVQAVDFQELKSKFPGILPIVATFFRNYDGLGTTKIQGWADECRARREVKKWTMAR